MNGERAAFRVKRTGSELRLCDCVAFLSEVLYSRYASPPGCVAGREGRVTYLFATTLPGRNSKVTSFSTLCKFHSLLLG